MSPRNNTGLFQRSTRLRRRSERFTFPELYEAFIEPIPVAAEIRFAPHLGHLGSRNVPPIVDMFSASSRIELDPGKRAWSC